MVFVQVALDRLDSRGSKVADYLLVIDMQSDYVKFATGLLLVSSRIFEKRRASCFTNPDLKDFLEGNAAKSLEFIGVDGNGCVKASILAAVKENYQVSVDLSAVGVANQKKFKKTLHKWHSVGVIVEGELS